MRPENPQSFTAGQRRQPMQLDGGVLAVCPYFGFRVICLDKAPLPSPVNNPFHSFCVRDKSAHERGGNEEICSHTNPGCRGAGCCWSDSYAQQPGKFLASAFSSSAAEISQISNRSNKDCATSVTPKVKILSSNTATLKATKTGLAILPLNWCARTSMFSSPLRR